MCLIFTRASIERSQKFCLIWNFLSIDLNYFISTSIIKVLLFGLFRVFDWIRPVTRTLKHPSKNVFLFQIATLGFNWEKVIKGINLWVKYLFMPQMGIYLVYIFIRNWYIFCIFLLQLLYTKNGHHYERNLSNSL